MKIGLFDSGLGGLTVWNAVRTAFPKADLVYYGDTLHLPYGEKSPSAIQGYAKAITNFLVEQGCTTIVIACNSASAVAGKFLAEQFPDLAFFNVIDPVVQHVGNQQWKNIGVIGTRATVDSGAYEMGIKEVAPQMEVKCLPTPLLVPLIEEGFIHTQITAGVFGHYVKEGLGAVDAILPGCTHYPLLADWAASIVPNSQWINTPKVVASHIKNELGTVEGQGTSAFFLSDSTVAFETQASSLFGVEGPWETKRL